MKWNKKKQIKIETDRDLNCFRVNHLQYYYVQSLNFLGFSASRHQSQKGEKISEKKTDIQYTSTACKPNEFVFNISPKSE